MKKKSYCTQNDGDCPTCSLVNYGRDCRNNPVDYVSFSARTLGRKGGSVKSPRKAKSSAANLAEGREKRWKKEEKMYTMENTEGFTQQELDRLNAELTILDARRRP